MAVDWDEEWSKVRAQETATSATFAIAHSKQCMSNFVENVMAKPYEASTSPINTSQARVFPYLCFCYCYFCELWPYYLKNVTPLELVEYLVTDTVILLCFSIFARDNRWNACEEHVVLQTIHSVDQLLFLHNLTIHTTRFVSIFCM